MSEKCPDGLLPDGPTCPRCGGYRGPSGIEGGSWVHCPAPTTPDSGSPPSDYVPVLRDLKDVFMAGYRAGQKDAAPAHPPAALPEPPIPFPGRREVEREIERTENPTGMRLNDSKERVILPGGTLRRMLRIIDATPPARPALPGGGLAAAERLIRLRKNVGNAEYERQCDDWLAHLRLAEGK